MSRAAHHHVRAIAVQRQPWGLHVAGQIGDLIGNMQISRLPLYSTWLHNNLRGRTRLPTHPPRRHMAPDRAAAIHRLALSTFL